MENDTALPCEDKMAFDTEKDAAAAALAVDWQRGTALKPYQCQHCKLWHLTSA